MRFKSKSIDFDEYYTSSAKLCFVNYGEYYMGWSCCLYILHDFYVWCFLNAVFKFDCYLGNDVIAQAQSNTGKTFAISSLEKIDTTKQMTPALVIDPTRELVEQVGNVYTLLSFLVCIFV